MEEVTSGYRDVGARVHSRTGLIWSCRYFGAIAAAAGEYWYTFVSHMIEEALKRYDKAEDGSAVAAAAAAVGLKVRDWQGAPQEADGCLELSPDADTASPFHLVHTTMLAGAVSGVLPPEDAGVRSSPLGEAIGSPADCMLDAFQAVFP
jgi:hypothetical protein